MNKPLGGRGKKAPYETQIIRVPIPIVPKVEQIISEYRSYVINGEVFQSEEYSQLVSSSEPINHSELLKYVEEILEAQKHLAASLAILLKLLNKES